MVEDFDAVFGCTNINGLTNKFIRNRILAIPDSYVLTSRVFDTQ